MCRLSEPRPRCARQNRWFISGWEFLSLFVLVFCLAAHCTPASAKGLVGTVSVEAEDKGDSVKFKDGDRETPVLHGQTAEIELRPPTWIQGKVFSNEDMLMYSFYTVYPFKKEWRWEIPARKTKIKLKPKVVQHWKGFKPEGQCEVTCIPMGKGKFRFKHERPDGPHGYMERIGFTANDYPKYRFWFDDESGGTPSEENKTVPESKSEANAK